MIERELVRRALRAWCSGRIRVDHEKEGFRPDIPKCGRVVKRRHTYVVLFNSVQVTGLPEGISDIYNITKAIYLVKNDGALKRLHRWPKGVA